MAQTVIGFTGKDFVMVASTSIAGFYYIKMSLEVDSIVKLDNHKLLAMAGENADQAMLGDWCFANMTLQRMRANGRESSTAEAANDIASKLAHALRRGPIQVNSLIAGVDSPMSEFDDGEIGPQLYYLDYLGTILKLPFAAHGYGASFAMALLDSKWHPEITLEEGYKLMQLLIGEIKKRIIVSQEVFIVKQITAEKGVEVVTHLN